MRRSFLGWIMKKTTSKETRYPMPPATGCNLRAFDITLWKFVCVLWVLKADSKAGGHTNAHFHFKNMVMVPVAQMNNKQHGVDFRFCKRKRLARSND